MTKQELQEAFEQGLELELDDTNIKIIQIIDNIYFVSFNGSANLLACTIDRFKSAEVINKPKYNGKAVKCDNIEQIRYLSKDTRHDYEFNASKENRYYLLGFGYLLYKECCIENNYEIISFSDYCKEQGIEEPKWNQGFEVRDGYNDLVMVRDNDFTEWKGRILSMVTEFYFIDKQGSPWKYARLPKKDEFNINFAE